MKKTRTVLLLSVLTTFIGVISARPAAIWTVDENGPALLSGAIVGYANGFYRVDPVSGLLGWYYPLGPSVAGDLWLQEPPNTNVFSDLLRFDGQGVFFFSDLEPGEINPDHADVPQLPPFNPNPNVPTIFRLEVGPEGNNGFLWAPGPGQPGFDTSGVLPGVAYNIISDAVPEPNSLILISIAGTGLIARRLRRSGNKS